MKTAAIKSALESAAVALLVAGVCLWFIVSTTQKGDDDTARIVMSSLGLVGSLVAHIVYMVIALRRGGRSAALWILPLILLFPITSVVLGIILYQQVQEREQELAQAQAPAQAGGVVKDEAGRPV